MTNDWNNDTQNWCCNAKKIYSDLHFYYHFTKKHKVRGYNRLKFVLDWYMHIPGILTHRYLVPRI